MTLARAEAIAATATAKPYAMREAALLWARTASRTAATREQRARAGAVADTLHADMAERDRRAAAAFAAR